MKRNNIITRLSIAALVLSAPVTFAQDIHFTQFDMQPLVINPAYTGMFFGKVRANVIYRDQWKSVTIPYKTIAASVDLPIKSEDNGYLAGGLQVYRDVAGSGDLSNFTGLVSLAYHKTFGVANGGNEGDYQGADLAVGLQAGYAQKSIDLSKLFFGDEFQNGSFASGTSQEWKNGLGNSVNYYLINAGISYAQAINSKFSFVIGLAANNINQPSDAILKKKNSEAVLDMRYTGEVGAIWNVGDRFSLRPVFLYQYQATATEMIFGNEFHYSLTGDFGDTHFTPAVFLGGYLRNEDAAMITAGLEYMNLRLGLGYDYNISSLNTVSNGNGGFEIALKYINPYTVVRRRTIPCNRF